MQHYLVEVQGKTVSHVLKGQQRPVGLQKEKMQSMQKQSLRVPQLPASISSNATLIVSVL